MFIVLRVDDELALRVSRSARRARRGALSH
jgi:hypothetical protein